MIPAAELTGRELDTAVAREVCGYHIIENKTWPTSLERLPVGKTAYHLALRNGDWAPPNHSGTYGWGWTDSAEEAWTGVPNFSANLNACRDAEREIERRGLMPQYEAKLTTAVARLNDTADRPIFLFMADAGTRCRAMIAAVRSAK